MKFNKIIPFFIAILALMSSCADDATITLLDKIQVSTSYVSIPVNGGSDTITVMANDSFKIEIPTTVKWLTVSTLAGAAGESTLIFKADSTVNGRSAEIKIICGDQTQRINIIQGLSKVVTATCAEVIAGPESKNFQVTGVCTSISNTLYGNWYLKDNTGTVYVYGTLDAKGAKKNFLSLGLEAGDEVTVQGPKLTYGTTVELVDVTVLKINKSLVKVDSIQNAVLPVGGGELTAYLTCKGQGVSVDIPEDAKSWLSISSIQSAGTKTVMKFNAATNTGANRKTTLTFGTTDGIKSYSVQKTINQTGAL